MKTKGSLEILSQYRTDAHLVREHRIRIETPGLPLFNKGERELTGIALDEAREKAEREFPITPTLGECSLLPGQRELQIDTETLDPSSVARSQMRILLLGLQSGGKLDLLTSLWSNLNTYTPGPNRPMQYDWKPERVFVSILYLRVDLIVSSSSRIWLFCFNRESSSTCSKSCCVTRLRLLVNVACVRFNSTPRLEAPKLILPFGLGMCTMPLPF